MLGCEACKRLSDGFDEGAECSCGSLARCCFELGKSLFDGIEAGAVGRQITQRRAGLLDRVFDAANFVTGKIVHDGGIALAQGRGEKMLAIDQEDCSIHRPIEYAGRG